MPQAPNPPPPPALLRRSPLESMVADLWPLSPCLVVVVRSEAAAAPRTDGGGSVVGAEVAMEQHQRRPLLWMQKRRLSVLGVVGHSPLSRLLV
jgi:hypothetical protein